MWNLFAINKWFERVLDLILVLNNDSVMIGLRLKVCLIYPHIDELIIILNYILIVIPLISFIYRFLIIFYILFEDLLLNLLRINRLENERLRLVSNFFKWFYFSFGDIVITEMLSKSVEEFPWFYTITNDIIFFEFLNILFNIFIVLDCPQSIMFAILLSENIWLKCLNLFKVVMNEVTVNDQSFDLIQLQ